MEPMPALSTSILWTVITFSILVVLHEGGHFLAARLFGIKVHEFMIGLPGPAIRYHGKHTDFGITAFLLGGYVRIAGMEPGVEDDLLAPALKAAARARTIDGEGLARDIRVDRDRADSLLVTLADWGAVKATEDGARYTSNFEAGPETDERELLGLARKDTYKGAKTWQRILILVSGVVVNLVAAILAFTVILAIFGAPEVTLTLDEVGKGTAAEAAGLRPGDEIVEFDGRKVKRWEQLVGAIAATEPGEDVSVTYVRDGERVTRTVPMSEEDGQPRFGVSPQVRTRDYSVWEALVESLALTAFVFSAIMSFFNPDTFKTAIEGTRSVIGISEDIGMAVEAGPLSYAWLVAALSLSLGVLNILPIPPLDGGKVLLEVIEKAIGHPLRREISMGISVVGALLLFVFIGFVMYADIRRMTG